MAIEYIEICNREQRELIGIIDAAKSIIWHSVYFGVGDFEIYAIASERHLSLLQIGNYVTRPDDIEVGVIESVQITNNAQDGLMIVASGRFAKSILDRRHIYQLSSHTNTATILQGNVEQNIRNLVSANAINCTFDTRRNMPILKLGDLANIPKIIVDEQGQPTQKQVSYENLLEYSDSVLEEYELGATVMLDDDTKELKYCVYEGTDRSVDNADNNNPVIFSYEYDNLTETNYQFSEATKKTAALIGGEGEGLDRFYSIVHGTSTGLDRRETWVDASSLNKKYKDDQDVEREYTDAQYKAMLDAQGKQELASLIPIETFDGTLNVTGGVWRLNEHYMLGDIVTVEDKNINKFANVRIVETTEAQDENGYSVDITYRS